jgi:hypothetical protein
LGLTLSSSGIFGGQISTASWTTSGLSTGTPYSVTIQFKGVVGYEWASVTALNYTFNITVSAAT